MRRRHHLGHLVSHGTGLHLPNLCRSSVRGTPAGTRDRGFIVQSPYLSWRWVDWMTLIISAVVLGIVVFFQPETFPPVLLKWKAKHLRDLTGDDRYRAEIEIRSETFMQRLGVALYRPFLLTATEPIIILIALYLTVVYIGKSGFASHSDAFTNR